MENSKVDNAALFQVFLRLRPPRLSAHQSVAPMARILTVEEPPSPEKQPTHVTLNPPNDNRRRAVERFAFTQIFKEEANQLDVFEGTGVLPLIEGALGANGDEGRNGLLASLGVTGSGKTHTMIGSRHQRGLIQLILDVLFRSISNNLLMNSMDQRLHEIVAAADPTEAQVMPAQVFLENMHPDSISTPCVGSRAQTPSVGELNCNSTLRRTFQQTSIPCLPDISHVTVRYDPFAQYAILISMYEVYNDRIFDLLIPAMLTKSTKKIRRRPLLYKHTERSPHQKVVAGLRKILCGTIDEALMVLDAGLNERQVAGTGSNSVSSRSHGFISIEIKKKRPDLESGDWKGSSLTIVDLAGSERARNAKTQGATLAEAGKINESLMYLGQCLQMQCHPTNHNKHSLVPFRQCKLTELLFSNCFPHTSNAHCVSSTYRSPQKAIMIVTADPIGDFNSTSQILRYSALAREVTIPRIPSVASSIVSQSVASAYSGSSQVENEWGIQYEHERETMELAALEIARLSDEMDCLRAELDHECKRRVDAEARVQSLTSRLAEIETEVREECFKDMEKRIEVEMRRWKAMWALEIDLKDEHLDRKLEIYTRSINIAPKEDEENKENAYARVSKVLETKSSGLKIGCGKSNSRIQGQSPSKPKRLPLREARSCHSIKIDSEATKSSSNCGNKIIFADPSSPRKRTQGLTGDKSELFQENNPP